MSLNFINKSSKPAKIAFCLFKYFPYGGLQRDFLRIARATKALGFEIHIFTSDWQGEKEPGMTLHLLKSKGWQNHTRNLSFARALGQSLKANPMDLVVGFNKMPHLDIYYTADVCYQDRVKLQRPWWYRFLPRYRQHLALETAVFAKGQKTKILLISAQQEMVYRACYETEASRFTVLPPGIARDRLAPPNAAEIRGTVRKELGVHEEQHLFLMVGSGFKTKGVDRSIRALAALPQEKKSLSVLIIIGQDDPNPFLKLARQLQVEKQIHFLGGRSDVPRFLLAADCLLHPSYHDNTGTAILEALASRLPVLTIESCGYAFYVEQAQAGIVMKLPFSQDAFNASLASMLNAEKKTIWQENAFCFAKEADIYSLPEKAADFIGSAVHELQNRLPSFDEMMQLKGDIYRHQKGRLTQRINWQGGSYFIKQHTGIGWREIIKDLLQFRLPILGAENEYLAIQKLSALGVSVPAAVSYGERGKNPAKKMSYVLMKELRPVKSLEELSNIWQTEKPTFALKQALIKEVANIARILHRNGMNHRDFYICHFLIDVSQPLQASTIKLYLIDLHRAQIRRKTPLRWIIKDLAGLYFSSKESGLTKRDWYRFMKVYQNKPLRESLTQEKIFWDKVKQRGEKLYREHLV